MSKTTGIMPYIDTYNGFSVPTQVESKQNKSQWSATDLVPEHSVLKGVPWQQGDPLTLRSCTLGFELRAGDVPVGGFLFGVPLKPPQKGAQTNIGVAFKTSNV